jgi:hypothetical protein
MVWLWTFASFEASKGIPKPSIDFEPTGPISFVIVLPLTSQQSKRFAKDERVEQEV